MRLAIMQPYFFPYLGYFQLIHAVDAFVVYDDVNFIKGGWINRNFTLSQGKPSRVTLELMGASSNALIHQVRVGRNREKLLKHIQQSYSKAPCFSDVFPIIEEIIMFQEDHLALYLSHGLKRICDYLGLQPTWYLSSGLDKDNQLRGQDKVLAICEELGATHYVNVPGGRELYDHKSFEEKGIKLSFIQPKLIEYQQGKEVFVPNLSIIDVMMFNHREECQALLEGYSCHG